MTQAATDKPTRKATPKQIAARKAFADRAKAKAAERAKAKGKGAAPDKKRATMPDKKRAATDTGAGRAGRVKFL